MSDLGLKLDGGAGSFQLKLWGCIDERAQLAQSVERVSGQLVIDTGEVTFINSVGVREWIRMLRALEARGVRVVLRRCAEVLVMQMSMVSSARGHAVIESFYAPYACAACDHETEVCLDLATHGALLRGKRTPTAPCPACGGTMRLAELADRYLAFLDLG